MKFDFFKKNILKSNVWKVLENLKIVVNVKYLGRKHGKSAENAL